MCFAASTICIRQSNLAPANVTSLTSAISPSQTRLSAVFNAAVSRRWGGESINGLSPTEGQQEVCESP
ncbi:hypothetical protein X777_16167 [Ooceraea biroi]|uniref:Uncharacterized protein n=1 Tax=Ooceraea biroi TaxID=2015173 RepID=A0A026WXU1_OOCBI|nr:hypothetical protein X777_16167 [Ooceraea biroi]